MQQTPDLNSLLVFVKVVELRSFTEAARLLHVQKSTVSRLISSLESQLNRQLIYRTTRKIEPTPQGRDLFSKCYSSVSSLIQGFESSLKNSQPMQGRIRIAAVQDIGINLVSPIIAEFAAMHPRLEVEMLFEDKVTDLVASAIDISVRAGRIQQQSYRGRKVGSVRFILVASPDYLARTEQNISMENLEKHDFLSYQPMLNKGHFLFEKNDSRIKFTPRLRYQSVSTLALHHMACAGAGISALPDFLCEESFKNNKLVRILKGWATRSMPISVVTPAKRDTESTVAVFSSFLSKKLSERFEPSDVSV